MNRPLITFATVLILGTAALGPAARAGTIVIANRTATKITFQYTDGDAKAQTLALAGGELCSLVNKRGATVNFNGANGPQELPLNTNSAYCFVDPQGKLGLREIALSANAEPTPAAKPTQPTVENLFPVAPETPAKAEAKPAGEALKKILTIPVKVLVDDDEQATAHAWKGRLSRRLQAANDIFEKECRVKFEIVAYDEWVSDNHITDFSQSLTEFEQKVKPEPARLAIGFTSQYEVPRGAFHLGGTRGPMHSHVLVREWSKQITEPERLEVMMHELGHFLGAVHSPAADSVMRPILGDRVARVKDFRIIFDPVNVLAMSLVSEDMRARDVHSFGELSAPTQLRLNDIYSAMGVAMPRDATADQYRKTLRAVPQQ